MSAKFGGDSLYSGDLLRFLVKDFGFDMIICVCIFWGC